jgi:multidrug resistance efflux pump
MAEDERLVKLMSRETVRRFLPLGILVAAVVISVIYLLRVSSPSDGALRASGTIEAVQVIVAPVTSGRVVAVMVDEGDLVSDGDVLFQMEDDLLLSQREQVLAAGEAAIAAAALQVLSAEQALNHLYDDWPLIAAETELAVAQARDALDDAERLSTYQQKGNRATSDTIDATEAQLVLAQDAVDRAQDAYNRVKDRSESDPQRAAARAALEEARDQRDAVQSILNWYQGEPTDIDQALLDARVVVAQAQLTQAEKEWQTWQDGPDPEALELAQAQLQHAQAQLTLARAKASADRESIELQLEDFLVEAPVDGTVLTRAIEPGEVVVAGGAGITLADLDHLRITVYVPEDRYGQIQLDQRALLTVDSFPDLAFEAYVAQIADSAEFTPRNVQTEEGRRTMVFAIELRINDPRGLLKPGMPGDVSFQDS